ncbi:hypothetical protein N7492_003351 [Penicillium capsulatum]|uniref:Aminoglycoside phosphotransferase domain-containing protein n=1 Tax=Penicillium capsulatum TaxID=69766 RepID=A0A9W9IN00_9EURO|nr:hypothetical protein N7492_003351 [Penicillium capsulatum]KAJ6122064.1 hypothetical protein N7512_004529 [Penicillium capsulatum]
MVVSERATLDIDRGPLSLPDDHIRSLEAYLEIAAELLPSNELLHPLLHHPDLQPNNRLVSDDLEIVGLIDWQHTSALPFFLASGTPKFFQNYDTESLAFRPPSHPDLSGMNDEEKANALDVSRRRHTHFFYLAFTQRFNEPHFRAMDRPTAMLTRRIFSHAADSIMHLQSMQEEVDLHLKRIRGVIGISVDGWTTPDAYDSACSCARQMKVDGLASLDTEYERKMTDRHWPFDDHDEDE